VCVHVHVLLQVKAGFEAFGIVRKLLRAPSAYVLRPVTTIDTFMRERAISHAHFASIDVSTKEMHVQVL
jgi:hypothetical protein